MHLGKTRNQKKMIMEYVTPSAYDLLLSEEDVKLRYITPAITSKGWSVTNISMEAQVKLTDCKINLRGNLVARGEKRMLLVMATGTGHEKRTALDAKID